MNAHAFSVTWPAASTGRVEGYPFDAITRYQAPSQMAAKDRYDGRAAVNEFAVCTPAKARSIAPVTSRATT